MEPAFAFMVAACGCPAASARRAVAAAGPDRARDYAQRHAAPDDAPDLPVPRRHQAEPAAHDPGHRRGAARHRSRPAATSTATCMCGPNPHLSRAHARAYELARAISRASAAADRAPTARSGSTASEIAGGEDGGRRADLRQDLPAAEVQDRGRGPARQRRRRLRPRSRLHRHRRRGRPGRRLERHGRRRHGHDPRRARHLPADRRRHGFCAPEQAVDVAEKVVIGPARLRRPHATASTPGSSTRSTTTASPGSGPRSSGAWATRSQDPRPFALHPHGRPLRLDRGRGRATGTSRSSSRTAAIKDMPERPMRTACARSPRSTRASSGSRRTRT